MAIYGGPWQGGVHHLQQNHGRSKGGNQEDAIKVHGRKGLSFFSVIFMILDIFMRGLPITCVGCFILKYMHVSKIQNQKFSV